MVSVTDFEFEGGILFPDIISLNFTMSVDPDKERPVGSGDLTTAIVMHPVCSQPTFHDWPADADTFVGCGSMYVDPFVSSSPGNFILVKQNSPFLQSLSLQNAMMRLAFPMMSVK